MESLQSALQARYKQQIDKAKRPKSRAKCQLLADRIHEKLGFGEDFKHYPLLVRIAKHTPEARIEAALSWISDYPKTRNKMRLFMWKLKDLRINAKKSIPTTNA